MTNKTDITFKKNSARLQKGSYEGFDIKIRTERQRERNYNYDTQIVYEYGAVHYIDLFHINSKNHSFIVYRLGHNLKKVKKEIRKIIDFMNFRKIEFLEAHSICIPSLEIDTRCIYENVGSDYAKILN
jgi:hypothetical protein